METQQPLKLQVIFTRTMVAALITDWLQTKVPPRMISKRYVTVVCDAHSSLCECCVLSNLKHFAACAWLVQAAACLGLSSQGGKCRPVIH